MKIGADEYPQQTQITMPPSTTSSVSSIVKPVQTSCGEDCQCCGIGESCWCVVM